MNYFAYGSNMSLARLARRLPGVHQIGTYRLTGYSLCFHKAGQDGSAKCDAFRTGDREHGVLGVLYRLDPAQRELLDRIEGVGQGYQVRQVTVRAWERESVETAFIYCATRIDRSLLPFSWYRNHVLIGAGEACLPQSYRDSIASVAVIEDHDRERDRRERAIHRTGGFHSGLI